jgi:two-component system response regulator FixJ
MKNGAVDFIEKPFSDDTLLAAVEEGFARQARALAGAADAEAILARLRRLTPREAEVLDGLVQGLPNKSIAYDLKISARTVEIHRANLMEKMQAGSLPDLVRMVLTARAAP